MNIEIMNDKIQHLLEQVMISAKHTRNMQDELKSLQKSFKQVDKSNKNKQKKD